MSDDKNDVGLLHEFVSAINGLADALDNFPRTLNMDDRGVRALESIADTLSRLERTA